MGRPRKNPDADAKVLEMLARGIDADTIAAETGLSKRTAERRIKEHKPTVNAARAPKIKTPPAADSGPPLPASADDIPADASMETLLHFRRIARVSIDAASDEGDLKLLGTLINTAGAVEDRIARRTPRPVDDPNDAPDMVALGREVAERLVKAIDLVTETM